MRAITRDNLATPSCPVWRLRIRTPLTPRAVRAEIARELAGLSDHERERRYHEQLTPLDKLLTDDEAHALEEFAMCEELLSGNARCSDYAGDRVQTSRNNMSPIADRFVIKLALHSKCKKMLGERELIVLYDFCAQMRGEGLSDAALGLKHGLPGRNKARAWQDEVKRVAERLSVLA